MALLSILLFSTSYSKVWDAYWGSWTLNPFAFIFPKNFSFDLPQLLFLAIDLKPVINFELTGLEMFETAVAVQLATSVCTIVEHVIRTVCRKGFGENALVHSDRVATA